MKDKQLNETQNITKTPLDNNFDNQVEKNHDDDIELIDVITADEDEIEEQDYDVSQIILDSEEEDLIDVIESPYAIDIAIAMEDFDDDEILSLSEKISAEHMAQIMEQADEDLQKRIAEILGIDKMLTVFHHMSKDDIADILGNVPINMRKNILNMMKRKDTIEIQNLLLYEDDSAGGLMTTEFIALNSQLTVDKALSKIREIGPKTEVIETIFILNNKKELIGTADLRDILVEDSNVTLEEIMYDNIISVTADMDQEEVSHIVSKYDLKVVPVINRKNSLLGIITVDDILDVVFEEQTEDILKMGGVSSEENVESTVFKSVRMRLPWLILNMFTAFIASMVVSTFEDTIAQVTCLAAAMPIIAGMGGNAGTQALSIVITNITTGDLSLKNDWKLVGKEIALGLINGIVIGLVTGTILSIQYNNIYLGFIMIAAMIANLVIACVFGFLIPLILKALNIDPALASSIFLTTITDVFGFFILLSLSKVFLPYLI